MNDIATPLVSICCITYNHASYIHQCLDGFIMQQTNFTIEILIHDDASTDGTSDIIREYESLYPDIIKPIYQIENQYSKGVRVSALNFSRAQGKYLAFCEGDDYWTDPLKLQKQVDILESHPDYGVVYTDFNMYYQNQGVLHESVFKTLPHKFRSIYNNAEDFLYSLGYMCPPSWLWRKSLLPFPDIKTLDGSFVMFVHFLSISKAYYMEDVTVTYRILEESASHSRNYDKLYRRRKSLIETQLKLIEKYNFSESLKERCLLKFYSTNLIHFVIHNQQNEILESKAFIVHPSLKENILYFLNNKLGRIFLKICVSIYSFYKKYNK